MDWAHFTPWSSLAGGVLIGCAAAMLLLFNGRIAGISGIVGGLLAPAAATSPGGVAFVVGLLAAPVAFRSSAGVPLPRIDAGLRRAGRSPACWSASARATARAAPAATACADCRGCRPARWSRRLAFMAAGIATVFVAPPASA